MHNTKDTTAENIENCNSCDTAEKLVELLVQELAKFSEDLLDMAKENWCESHIIMLRRLIIAVSQGTRYDETLLPEEAEIAFEKANGRLEANWKLGYQKAIEDLLEDANEMAIEVDTGTYTMKAIGIGLLEQIAEQLKVGA